MLIQIIVVFNSQPMHICQCWCNKKKRTCYMYVTPTLAEYYYYYSVLPVLVQHEQAYLLNVFIVNLMYVYES